MKVGQSGSVIQEKDSSSVAGFMFRRLLVVVAGCSLYVGGVNPCGDSVYLQVGSLPVGFKGLGLMFRTNTISPILKG